MTLKEIAHDIIRNGFVITHGPNSYFFFDLDHNLNQEGNVVRPQGFIFYVSNDIIPCNIPACIGRLTYYWQSNNEGNFWFPREILLEGLHNFPAMSFTWSSMKNVIIKPNRVHIYNGETNTLEITEQTCDYLLDKPFVDEEKWKNYENAKELEILKDKVWELEKKLSSSNTNIFSKPVSIEEALAIANSDSDLPF